MLVSQVVAPSLHQEGGGVHTVATVGGGDGVLEPQSLTSEQNFPELCGVFAQQLGELRAEFLDLLQVHLMSRVLIEPPIKACQSIGPCAAYSINCRFAPAVALSGTCTFREEQLHYLCATHEGGHMQGGIAIFVGDIDSSAFFEQ